MVFCLLLVVVAPQYGAAASSPLRVMTYNVYGRFVHDRVPGAGGVPIILILSCCSRRCAIRAMSEG